MEDVDDDKETRFSIKTPTYLGLGLGLGFLFLVRSQTQPLKLISTAVKLADGAIKVAKAPLKITSPSPLALAFASKALIKGYEVSKRFNPAASQPPTPSGVSKRLKAFVGAANLIRYARSPLVVDGFLGLGFLRGGYGVSKNFLKVLEGFGGFQLDSELRHRIKALGVVVRAAVVAREVKDLSFFIGRWRRRGNRCGFDRKVNFRSGVCLRYQRLDFGSSCGYMRGFKVEEFHFCNRAVIGFGGKPLQNSRASEDNELLCFYRLL